MFSLGRPLMSVVSLSRNDQSDRRDLPRDSSFQLLLYLLHGLLHEVHLQYV